MALVMFDCDGTLVDSQNAIFASMAQAFSNHGLAAPDRASVLGIVGLSLPQAVAALLPGAAEELVARVAETYRTGFGAKMVSEADRDPLYPGARQAVAKLAGDPRMVLGIATGKSQRGVARILEREGWRGHFRTVQTADDAPSKPHPGMLLQAMAETGAKPNETVMIGDTTFDIEMGRAAGAATIGVAWGYHPVSALVRAGAVTIAADFDELLALIGQQFGPPPRTVRGNSR